MPETANQYQRLAPSPAASSPQGPQSLQQQTQVQLPIQLQQVAQTAEIKPRYKYKKILYGLGLSEVVLGSVSVLFGFVTIIIAIRNPTYIYFNYYRGAASTGRYHHAFTYVSQGIWCGAFLIVTGILGIKAKSNPSVCMYNANMAMSIITANFMLPLMVLSGIAAGTAGYMAPRQVTSLTALHSILTILGFAAAILCIVHSAYCCAGVCCRRKSYRGPVVYAQQQQQPYGGPVAYAQQQYGVNQPQHMIQLANGQYMLVANQPVCQSTPAMPMVAGQMIYQPPQGGVIMPQAAVPPQAGYLHPTTIYPPFGNLQPVQATSATGPTQAPTGVQPPIAQASALGAPPSQTQLSHEQDYTVCCNL